MYSVVTLYSKKDNEIKKFLEKYFNDTIILENNFKWKKQYINPIDMTDIMGIYIDNNEKYNIGMWISLDKDIFLNITNYNVNAIIRYIYERYPY